MSEDKQEHSQEMKPADYYDKFNLNPLHFKKKRDAKHEFGLEYESIIPSEGEVRLLGNRSRQCKYYNIGVNLCHFEMLKNNSKTFLPCKKPIDAMWR